MFLKVNHTKVVSEMIDGETVIINLDSGSYYSLDGAGAQVWELLCQGDIVSQVIQRLVDAYGESVERIRTDIDPLIAELLAEGLIVSLPTEEMESHRANGDSRAEQQLISTSAFMPPKLLKYDDMQDLLILDPIHDVTSSGWPHTPDSEP